MPHSRKLIRRRKDKLDNYKVKRGCDLCGYNSHPYALHWDHRYGEKIKNVSQMIENRKLSVVFAEIRKCRLLCANCHTVISCEEQMIKHGYITHEDRDERFDI